MSHRLGFCRIKAIVWVAPVCAALLSLDEAVADEPPQTRIDGVRLQLAAEHPSIVTPIGMAFDARGRLLVVESHTHFPSTDYPGPTSDRIRILEDLDGDGRFDRFGVYHEGSRHAMCIEAHPNGWMYVTTRSKLFRLRGEDARGRATEEEPLVELQTPGDYPHNGLGGMAVDSRGRVYFGLGENLGESYALVGRDGITLRGGGEGGSIFRVEPDGRGLVRIATGFWNPFGLAFDPQGRLFAIENDPDSRPPCRLLHIVPGGDYGYQFRYGRSGVHPLQAWDGELPGTLPMVAGTGEGPSDVIYYRGSLWGTSWGHYRVERYALRQNGASWRGEYQTVVNGDSMFRPICFAEGPEGALYFSDWVDRSYNVHGQGRVWRLTVDEAQFSSSQHPPLSEDELRAAELMRSPELSAMDDADPFIRQAAVWGFLTSAGGLPNAAWSSLAPRQRVAWLQATHWRGGVHDDVLEQALQDASGDVRLMAVRIVAGDGRHGYRERLEAMLGQSIDHPDLFRGVAAALNHLDASEGESAVARRRPSLKELAWSALQDRQRSQPVRIAAAGMLTPEEFQAELARLPELLREEGPLTTTLLWRLLDGNSAQSRQLLQDAALNEDLSDSARAVAVLGLAADAATHAAALTKIENMGSAAAAGEARRALRGVEPDAQERPSMKDLDAWMRLVGQGGDASAGERRFFDSRSPGCARCHRHGARGAAVGPDLTNVDRQWDRRRLLQAMLDPSLDIAPLYRTEIMRLVDGRVLGGYVAEHRNAPELVNGNRDELLLVVDSQGRASEVRVMDVLERTASTDSIMPVELLEKMPLDDIRDLLAFLEQSGGS